MQPQGSLQAHITEWAERHSAVGQGQCSDPRGRAQQYITGRVQRLLAPLDSLAEAGGWWCSGLDPLADWAPMEWGQFKGDRPRQKGGKVLKYEAPVGQPTRSTWLRVPAAAARLGARSGERITGLQSCRCRHAWTFKLAGSS